MKENNSEKKTDLLKERTEEKNQAIEASLDNKDSSSLDPKEVKKSLEELGYSFEVGV